MAKELSISIAAYNMEKYIAETLDSIVSSNSLDQLEVFIVNDGSSDNTTNIVKRYVDKYPSTFILIDKDNGGWGSTVNSGLARATGRYFKLLDGDDLVQYIDSFIEYIKGLNADVIITPYKTFLEDTEVEELHGSVSKQQLNLVQDIDSVRFDDIIAMHSCTFKTECIKNRYDITEHCFYTDVEYVLKSMLNVSSIAFVDIPLYRYRIGRAGQSVSADGYRKHFLEHLKVLKGLLQIYKNSNLSGTIYDVFNKQLTNMVDHQYYIFLVLDPTAEHAEMMENYDMLIKQDYPEFYPTNRLRVKAFRLLGTVFYKHIIYKNIK